MEAELTFIDASILIDFYRKKGLTIIRKSFYSINALFVEKPTDPLQCSHHSRRLFTLSLSLIQQRIRMSQLYLLLNHKLF